MKCVLLDGGNPYMVNRDGKSPKTIFPAIGQHWKIVFSNGYRVGLAPEFGGMYFYDINERYRKYVIKTPRWSWKQVESIARHQGRINRLFKNERRPLRYGRFINNAKLLNNANLLF
jgi:hypothetical protein